MAARGMQQIPLAVDSSFTAEPVYANFPEPDAGSEFKLIAFEPAKVQPVAQVSPRGMGAVATDTLYGMAKGAGTTARAIGWLTGSDTLQGWGETAEDYWGEKQSADLHRQLEAVGKAEGVSGTVSALWNNPAAIGDYIATSLPMMVPGMAVGNIGARGIVAYAGNAARAAALRGGATEAAAMQAGRIAAEKAAEKAAFRFAAGANMLGEGAVSGGSTGAEVEQFALEHGATPEQAKAAANKSALMAGTWTTLGAGIGAGMETRAMLGRLKDSGIRGMAKNIGKEALEEAIQNPGEDFAAYQGKAPFDPTQTFDPGKAAVLGAITGGAMGAGFHAAGRASSRLRGEDREQPDSAIPTDEAGAGPGSGGSGSGALEGEVLGPEQIADARSRTGPLATREPVTYTQITPTALPRLALPAPDDGGPTDRQVSTAIGLLKHSPKASPELLQRMMRVDATMAGMLYKHWEAQRNGGIADEQTNAEMAAASAQGGRSDLPGSGGLLAPSLAGDGNAAGDGAEMAAPGLRPDLVAGGTGAQPGVTDQDIEAHAAATSPFNGHAEPTEAQKSAGNYRKGHLKFHGLDISIENPAGSVRSGKDASGKAWQTEMQHHYGYIRGTVGKDKDHLDVFIKPNAKTAQTAYVIDQTDPATGRFDEHKIILGADSEADARAIYQANYEDGWQGLGAITAMPVDKFVEWTRSGKTKKALAYKEPRGVREPAPAATGTGTTSYGKVGLAPGAAREISLNQNGDGTATVMGGSEPFYDFDSGEPVTVPEGATPSQVKQAIIASGAVTSREKWFGVSDGAQAKPADKAAKPEPKSAHDAGMEKLAEAWTADDLRAAAIKQTADEWHKAHIEALITKYGYSDADAKEARAAKTEWETHQDFLETALENGETIPQRVLDDYVSRGIKPDPADWPLLAKKLGQQNQEERTASPVAESQAPAPSEPGEDGVAPIQGGAAPDREKDAKGNPIYKVGDRVEFVSGAYEGRHGAVKEANAVRMVSVMMFSNAPRTEETTYHYVVTTDNGAEFFASPSEIKFETSRPESVVPDISIDGIPQPPQRIYDGIGYAKQSAEKSRAAAQRARKASSIAEHKRYAQTADEKAARYQAAWDAWAKENPAEAEKIAPKPVAKPPGAAPSAGGSAAATVAGGALNVEGLLKGAGLVVTKTTTKNGTPVWNVSGNTREHIEAIKTIGGRWYGPRKVWSFYNDDPSTELAKKLEGKVKPAEPPKLTENEIILPDNPTYIYGKVGDQWHYKAVGAKYEGYAGTIGGDYALKLDAALKAKQSIAGKPTIAMSDASLENLANSTLASPAAQEKARAELAARDQADEVDLGALFDEVLAEETANASVKEEDSPVTQPHKVTHPDKMVNWWQNELSLFGRRQALNAVGSQAIRADVKWTYLPEKWQKALTEIVGTDKDPMVAEKAGAAEAATDDMAEARKMLSDMDERIASQGRVVDDRLQEKANKLRREIEQQDQERFERAMRAAATTKPTTGEDGYVRTTALRYVALADALKIAREAVAAGVKPAPAQFHARLDLTMDSADRLIAELEKPQRTAGQAAVSAATNTAKGLQDAIAGLGKLFGSNGSRLSSGLTFDEETYAKAKPLFASAVAHFKDAGTDLKEAMRAVVRLVIDQFGPQVAENMKEYVVRFMEDVKAGNVVYDASKEEASDERTGSGSESTEALGTVAAEPDGRTESRGDVRGSDAGSGSAGAGRNQPADGDGVSGPRSGGSGTQDLHPAGSGSRREGNPGGTRGKRSAGTRVSEGVRDSGLNLDPADGAPSSVNVPAGNFVITDEVRLGRGGEAEKFRDNLAAIRALKDIEQANRRATPEEQRALARYVGWGGLANAFADPFSGEVKSGWEDRVRQLADLLTKKELDAARRSTRNAHYTSQDIVEGIWSAVQGFGFRGGLALEPSSGTGNFIGLTPAAVAGATRFIAIEYDSLTSRIAQALYPQSTVLHAGFHKVALSDGTFDLAIGNPPFGPESLRFQYKPELGGVSIHNQFFRASMDALKPGGIQAMVVSRYLMDAKDKESRLALAGEARLLGAIRLPDTAFKENAKTEVVTDILFLQKLTPDERASMAEAINAYRAKPEKDYRKEAERQANASRVPEWVGTTTVPDPLGGDAMEVNAYFADNREMIVGRLERSGTMQFGGRDEEGNRKLGVNVKLAAGQDYKQALADAIDRLPKDVMQQQDDVIQRSLARYQSLADALRISISGREAGHMEIETDGKLTQLLERETPEGAFELTKRELTKESPWSSQLLMDASGHWYKLDVKVGADGKPEKVMKDGKATKRNVYERVVYAIDADIPASMRLGDAKFARLTKMVELRDLLVDQLDLETTDADVKAIEDNRKRLNAAYRAFVAQFEHLSKPSNAALVSEMPDGALILALELSYRPELTAAKAKRTKDEPRPASAVEAPILTRRVVFPYEPPASASAPSDALLITMAERGVVDMKRIAELLGTSEEDAATRLQEGENPLVFMDPETQAWVSANEYLSGQVKRKLNAAKSAGLDANVKALEKVQPEAWGAENVSAHIGSTWVPPAVYAEFITHLTGNPAGVSYARVTNSFSVQGSSDTATGREWSSDRYPAHALVSDLLNSKAIKVTYTDLEGKTHTDNEATAMAQLKARQIEAEFSDWIFADAERRSKLVEIFNEKFNTRVNRQFDGSHLTLPGKVPDEIIAMRRHQKNVIWRGISQRAMLIDHVVGAGKTFSAIARAMERRRMGLSRKPMVVVPNHLVEQWAADTYRLYPGAKVLAAGRKDFEKARRRRLFGKIATGDWDLVIVPHSSFGFIGISQETEQRYLETELAKANEAIKEAWEEAEEQGLAGGRRKPFNVKEAERLAETIEGRMEKLKRSSRDNLLTFEQMGVDDLTVDEAHEFKNLFYSSRLMNVRGMGDKTGSQKAFDLYNKVRVLTESPTGTVTFMTGTPISNSAVEMYTMMRYLAAKELDELGLDHFDAWRAQYVDVDTKFEPTESGRLKEVNRMGRSWSNMRALMNLYYSFTDAVSQGDIQEWYRADNAGQEYPIPKVKGGERQRVVVKPTEAQIGELERIIAGFDGLESIDDPYERNAARLRLMDRARKVSLDVRAVIPSHTSTEAGGKLEKVAAEAHRIYQQWNADKGTQLIFLDRSVPKAKGDDKLIKEYDQLQAEKTKALNDGDEDAYRKAIEKLEKFSDDEIAELRSAQAGGWNAYDQIKKNLIALGVPENEIRFIQEANNDAQKKALFDAVNDGEVRILIGSTPRMGAGTNVQERLVGLHHVDVTWKPSDIEQREGRIIRQGNRLLEKYGMDGFAIEILAYATERTVDAKMWDLNATKLKMINGIRKYDGAFNMDFEDDESVGMAELAALASGDPLLLERVKLMSELDKLELLERGHRRKMFGIKDRISGYQKDIQQIPGWIAENIERADMLRPRIEAHSAAIDARRVTVDGQEYSSHFDAMKAAGESIASQQQGDEKAKYAVAINGEPKTSRNAIEGSIHDALGDTKPFLIEIGGTEHAGRNNAGKAVAEKVNPASEGLEKDGEKALTLGSMFGLDLRANVSFERFGSRGYGTRLILSLLGKNGRPIASDDAILVSEEGRSFTVAKIRNLFDSLAAQVRRAANVNEQNGYLEARLATAKKELPSLLGKDAELFPQAAERDTKRARLEAVIRELAGKDTKKSQESGGGASGMESRSVGVQPTDETPSTKALRDVVSRFKTEFKGAAELDIRVVRTASEIIERYRPSPFAEGVYHADAGLIYLVTMNLRDARGQVDTGRAFQVLMHEAVGHYGLAAMMGDRFAGILKQVQQAAKAKGKVTDDTYHPGDRDYATMEAVKLRYPDATDAEVAQEVLARMAETDPGRTLFGYVRAVVRQWLRDMARAFGVTIDPTTAELNDMVALASRYMRRGGNLRGDAMPSGTVAASKKADAGAMESRQAPQAATQPVRQESRRGMLDTALRKLGGEAAAKITGPAYDKLTAFIGGKIPEGIKAGVVSDFGLQESYIDRRTELQTAQQKAARQTKSFVEQLMTLDRAQSRVAYQWLNNRGAEADRLMAQLPEESRQVLQAIKNHIKALTVEAVRLGQLDPETAARNWGAYLHRSYERYDLNTDDKGWKAERAKSIKILGEQYKGRGLKLDVDPDRIHSARGWWQGEMKGKRVKVLRNAAGRYAFVAEGTAVPPNYADYRLEGIWEIRARKSDSVITLWRDFTQEERQQMGEIDEAKYAVARTLFMMSRDIEVGRFHEWIADEYAKMPEEAEIEGLPIADPSESMMRAYRPDEWVPVPTAKIAGTGVFKFGALAGMVVPGPIWNDIRQIGAGRYEPFGAAYASILRAWKLSKTALTPTTHVNNIMGNFVMADMHDVGARDVVGAVRLMLSASKGDTEAKTLLDRFEDSGATQGMFTTHELRKEVLEPLLQQLREEVGMADDENAILRMSAVLSLALHGQIREAMSAATHTRGVRTAGTVLAKAQDYYQAEDAIFRLAAFLKGIDDGKPDLEAGKAARKAFLDYHINAPWINAMRGTMFPFVAFAYRAIPMLVETAARKPWKIAKYMLVAGGLNALAYAMLGADADEDKERAFLPDEKAGKLWGIVPKLIRMPWNRESTFRDGRKSSDPVFLDVRRWLPVGDVVDYGQDKTALPLIPQPLMPGGPAILAAEFLVNRSAFTGRELTKETDTWVEKAAKVGGHFYRGFAPNVPVPYSGTWAGTKIDNAVKGKEDPLGRAYPLPEAIASGFGVKLERYPVDTLKRNTALEMRGKLRELTDEQRKAGRDFSRRGMTRQELDETVADIVEKKKALSDEYREKQRRGAGG